MYLLCICLNLANKVLLLLLLLLLLLSLARCYSRFNISDDIKSMLLLIQAW